MTALALRCQVCDAVAWQGGTLTEDGDYVDLPIGVIAAPDGSTVTITAQDIWSDFAEVSCPQRGVGCPNTRTAVLQHEAKQPATAASVDRVQGLLDAAEVKLAELQALVDVMRPIAESAGSEHQALRNADVALSARLAALESAPTPLRLGLVSATTKTTATVWVDGAVVSARRPTGNVKTGDTVAVQRASGAWVIVAVIA